MKEKINQDSFIAKDNLCGNKEIWMFGILDGHGTDGHHVSGFAKRQLVDEFEIQMKNKELSNLRKIKRINSRNKLK